MIVVITHALDASFFISLWVIKRASHSGIKTLQKSFTSQNVSVKLSMPVPFFYLIFLFKTSDSGADI
jgi:hypothetical protein